MCASDFSLFRAYVRFGNLHDDATDDTLHETNTYHICSPSRSAGVLFEIGPHLLGYLGLTAVNCSLQTADGLPQNQTPASFAYQSCVVGPIVLAALSDRVVWALILELL